MTDIFARLHEAAWRGIQFPVAHREFGFSQDQESHRFIFRDEQLIESLGLTNPTYRYQIPFREGLARGPWKNLFVSVYPDFLSACTDRTKGILDDPIHGPVQVKCVSLQETAEPGRRDGVDVEVNFITAPDEDFSRSDLGAELTTIEGAQGLQHALDLNLSSTDIDDATKAQLAAFNKDANPAKVDPLAYATGAVNQVEVAGNKIAAGFGALALKMQTLDEAARRTADPNLAPIRSNARMLQLAAINLAKTPLAGRSGRSRKTSIYTVLSPIGTLSLAAKLGMTAQELLRLNPTIARTSTVQPGTQVAYFS